MCLGDTVVGKRVVVVDAVALECLPILPSARYVLNALCACGAVANTLGDAMKTLK